MTKENVSLTSVKARKSQQLIISFIRTFFPLILIVAQITGIQHQDKYRGQNLRNQSKTFLNLEFESLKIFLDIRFLALYGTVQETFNQPARSKDMYVYKNKRFQTVYYWARHHIELANLFLIQSLLALPHKNSVKYHKIKCQVLKKDLDCVKAKILSRQAI